MFSIRHLAPILAVLFTTQQAYAFKGCNYSKKDECVKAESNNQLDQTGQAPTICKYLHEADTACTMDYSLAITYGALAVVCGISCVLKDTLYGTAAGEALEQVCNIGGMAAAATDMIAGIVINENIKEYEKKSAKIIPKDYGISGYTAATATLVRALATYGVIGASSTGALASSARSNSGACISMVLDALFAGVKIYNGGQIAKNSEDNFKVVQDLLSAPRSSSSSSSSSSTRAMMTLAGTSTPGGSTGSINARDSAPADSGTAAEFNPKNLGAAFAMADTKSLYKNPHAKTIEDAFAALDKHLGLTPEKLADSLQNAGLGGTMEKAIGGKAGKDIGDMLRKFEADLAKVQAPTFEVAKAAAGAGSANRPFKDYGGSTGPIGTAGAQKMSFAGFDDDIWHAGTTMSIFDIVSKKTQTVSGRVQ